MIWDCAIIGLFAAAFVMGAISLWIDRKRWPHNMEIGFKACPPQEQKKL
jgi:hypothetical protein